MGTVIGLLVLASIAYLVKKSTGLHLHQWFSKKYQEYVDKKRKNKKST